jgi:hypothetical protein
MVASSRALAGDMATDLGVEEGGAWEAFEAALGGICWCRNIFIFLCLGFTSELYSSSSASSFVLKAFSEVVLFKQRERRNI